MNEALIELITKSVIKELSNKDKENNLCYAKNPNLVEKVMYSISQ